MRIQKFLQITLPTNDLLTLLRNTMVLEKAIYFKTIYRASVLIWPIPFLVIKAFYQVFKIL